eukprot:Opistho-2@10698
MASQKLEDWFAKVRSGDYDAVEKLLAKKASFWKGTVKATIKGRLPEVNDVEPGTENTALHIAAEIGSVRVVEVLLEGGAEASLRNGKGDTALHAAIRANKVDIVKQLVRVKGAHTEDRTAPRIAPIDTETCLHLACQLGRSAVVETLLGCGANVDALTSSTKRTPLHLAAAGGHPDIVLALLAQGASTSAKDGSGRTPSDLAVDAKTKGAFEEYAAQRASASSSGSHGTAKKQQEAPPPPEPKKPAGPDYYELLKVPRNVSPTTLKKSFRKLAVQYHPDKNPDAKDLFQQINHAFKVLSDPQQRDVYDKHGGDAVEELIQDNLRQKQTMVQEDLDDIFGDLAKEVDSAKANTEKNAEDDLLDRVEEQLSGMGHQPQATHNSHGVTSGYDEDVDSAASRPPVVVVADVDISVLDGLLDDIALHKSGSGIDENAGGGSKFGASPSVEDASHKRPASFHPERLFGFDPTANVLDSVQIRPPRSHLPTTRRQCRDRNRFTRRDFLGTILHSQLLTPSLPPGLNRPRLPLLRSGPCHSIRSVCLDLKPTQPFRNQHLLLFPASLHRQSLWRRLLLQRGVRQLLRGPDCS